MPFLQQLVLSPVKTLDLSDHLTYGITTTSVNMPMRDTSRLLANGNNPNTTTTAGSTGSSDISSALSIDSNQITHWPNRRRMEQLKKERCKANTCQILWVFLGIFLIIGALQMLWAPTYLDNIVHDGIKQAFIFTEPLPDDENYQSWLSNDNGMYVYR